MNIFGFKLNVNWSRLKTPEMERILNFLASQMTEKELKAEREKVRRELNDVRDEVTRKELNAQDDLLGVALMTKRFSK